MQEPRSAGAMGADFPYTLKTMCYIEVFADGSVHWGGDDNTYHRALTGTSRLFAVWPGEWSSHLFAIDDLDQYARAFRIIHDEARTGLTDHEHQVRWSVSPHEQKPTASYISINLWLDCGCTIRDLETFASQMRQQKGWHIATSGGWGSSEDSTGRTYSMRARRKSLAT
ncbi:MULTISPECIES: hypothetical protein [Amycolatopsis]|uniref:Uncharacterized protein n=1 Tax=Amycolatopsis thermalba TaxID=944492 RepID=A0ABY4NZC0_9PSEU|nr:MULTISPECIES: hypothetical protein [Amycolatopsis]UQS25352.1 hypothetical protein L1857_22350 [Amycolatopsis thermalba]